MSHRVLRRFYGYDYASGGQGLPALPDGGGFVTVTLAARRSRVEV